jgi:hypothetical protein
MAVYLDVSAELLGSAHLVSIFYPGGVLAGSFVLDHDGDGLLWLFLAGFWPGSLV